MLNNSLRTNLALRPRFDDRMRSERNGSFVPRIAMLRSVDQHSRGVMRWEAPDHREDKHEEDHAHRSHLGDESAIVDIHYMVRRLRRHGEQADHRTAGCESLYHVWQLSIGEDVRIVSQEYRLIFDRYSHPLIRLERVTRKMLK